MKNTLVISRLAFLEILRDPAVYLLTMAFMLFLFMLNKFVFFEFASNLKVIRDLGCTTIILWGLVFCVLYSQGGIHREFDQKLIYCLLAKPIRRTEYIFGKYVGLFRGIVLGVIVLLLTLTISIWFNFGCKRVKQTANRVSMLTLTLKDNISEIDNLNNLKCFGGNAIYSAFYRSSIKPDEIVYLKIKKELLNDTILPIFYSGLLATIKIFILASFSILFSLILNPVVSTCSIMALYIMGHVADYLTKNNNTFDFFAYIINMFVRIIPNLEMLNASEQIANNGSLTTNFIALSIFYGIIYTLLIISISTFVFLKRDLKN
jgi:Cu-processing system permease protein